MKSFNVIWQNFNKKEFESYDVIPYFYDEYVEAKNRPKTFEEFKEFIRKASMYMYWGRCQYEIIISGWPNTDPEEKWDIHKQVMMNIDRITELLMEEVKNYDKRHNKRIL